MKHYSMQTSLSLRDTVKTPRKRKSEGVKKIRSVKPDEQNCHLSNELLVWGLIHQPLWVQTLVAQPKE
jgi:hypothetical protein